MRCLILLSSLFLPALAQAAQRWIVVTTAHFQLYTSASEREARTAAQTFEQVYAFFSQRLTAPVILEQRVRIIAFNGESEFQAYRPNDGTFAFYQHTPVGDYIALQDIAKEHSQSVLHEYTHLVIRHSGLQLPVWLNEGLSDLYSTLEPYKKNTVIVGKLVADRADLVSTHWMDWNFLFDADQKSPYYNERDKMSIFYAQSWILTHMLYLNEQYSPRFDQFVETLTAGASSQEAFRSVYGKTISQVDADLRHYLDSPLRTAVLPARLPKSVDQLDVQPLDNTHLDVALAEIRLFSDEGADDGLRRLQALGGDHPEITEIHEALGYFFLGRQDRPAARSEFRLASQTGSRDPRLYYFLGSLQNELHDPVDGAIASLRKALDLDPSNMEARLLLGELYSNKDHYAAAIETLSGMQNVAPDKAFPWFSILAYCSAQLDTLDQAELFIQKALASAVSDDQREQMEGLAKFVRYRAGRTGASHNAN